MSDEKGQFEEEVSGDLSFIRSLNEGKMFRNKSDIRNVSYEQARDMLFLNTLTLFALSQESLTTDWAQSEASRSAAFSNFDRFRVGLPDLYNLAHIMMGETAYGDIDIVAQMKKNPMTAPMFLRFIRGIGADQNMDKAATQFFLRFEKVLGVDNGVYRSLRRNISNWNQLPPNEKKSALTRLYKFTLTLNPRNEFLPQLKRHIGHIAGLTNTQKAALGIAAVSAGFAAGYKMTRDNTIRKSK